MKKILLLITSALLLFGMTLGLAGCKDKNKGEDDKSYTLDCTEFNPVAVFGEELSLKGLKLVEAGGETVDVRSDMVKGVDTSTAGAKKLTVTYGTQTFTVDYTVKFRVTYVIEGVETVQLVSDVSEVTVPEPPTISGKQFELWSVQLPTVLTGNLRIDAIYKSLSNERETAYTWSGSGVINLSGYLSDGGAVECTVTDADGNELPSSLASVDASSNKLNYSVGNYDVIIISIHGDGAAIPKSWSVEKTSQPTLTMAGEAVGVKLGSDAVSQKITSSSTPVSFKYVTTTGNANANAAAAGGYLFIEPLKAGVTEITVKAVNSTNELEYITLKQYAVITPDAITIANDSVEYGIEDVWTVGKVNSDRLRKLSVSVPNADKIGEGFYSNISYVSSSSGVSVSDGAITLSGSGSSEIVEIKAVFSFAGVSFESPAMKVRCVYDGVNVYSYSELWTETQNTSPRPIILQNNIKDDFSSENYTWIKSTYDITYYENIGAADDARIKVLIQFRNDVWGNGYEINAHNATLGTLDSTGNPTDKSLFRGPLDFVKMSQTGGAISVKGQDNIVFAVYDNVTLNNVTLRSCELDNDGETADLTTLEYAGTTVEILGDNVTIEYSRLENGRTVLRVFGAANDPDKKIHLEVRNTILRASREFIARIGSNRFVQDLSEPLENGNPSPKLPEDTGSDYNTKKSYNKMTAEQKDNYDEKYINTFVTLENCVFEDAGIFAIAIDSHFAGPALHDGSGYLSGALEGWERLAKTSYGAKVTLQDDVRLYNWKPLNDIDSSTLVENSFASSGGDDIFSNLRFDVKTIIESAVNTNPNYSNILYDCNGTKYVHAGIAFFGGGKNYGVVENNILAANSLGNFNEYEVEFEDLGDLSYLSVAAGDEPFYFFIYDTTSTFTYETQVNMEKKYDCLYRK